MAIYNDLKLVLTSWKFTGSNFSRESIRENFPETISRSMWDKMHTPFNETQYNFYHPNPDTRIIFIICDPRDSAARLGFVENGWNCPPEYYNHKIDLRKTIKFLDDNVIATMELIDYYRRHFKNRMIILRYEDVVFNNTKFIKQLADFLKLEPLFIDSLNKYRHSNYKEIGIFRFYFDEKILQKHYNKYKFFYKKYGYPIEGHLDRYPDVDLSLDFKEYTKIHYPFPTCKEEYVRFLINNNVKIDNTLKTKIDNIDYTVFTDE